MSDQQALSTPVRAQPSGSGPVARFLGATELDTRLLGMVGALIIIWLVFNTLSGGQFLSPRNLWNLSVQTSSIAIMATGMVLVIVTRNIDLSVGSILGFTAMIMGVMQVDLLPRLLTFLGIGGLGHPSIWVLALIAGILVGTAIGALQGSIIAYLKVPAFIVTLGGFLVWRGAAWWVTAGRTVSPLDGRFQLIGGGPYGAIGAIGSWIFAAIGCAAILAMLYFGREQRRRFHFPLRPIWAEATLAALGCGLTLAAVWVANSYPWPTRIAARYATENNIPIPETGLFISHGIAIPVLIAIGAAVLVAFISRRTRFGRYIFAIGGNPEAAELAGINTRWVTVKVYMLMGALVGLSAAVASARLQSSTNALGELDELYVIAAAVIGGTSLSGGVGTVAGAVLGAVVMQSLQSGMVLIGLDSPLQKIVVGVVLVFAVWLDTLYRRRAK